jgi:nucleoside-diphosphate-sugar epimerase
MFMSLILITGAPGWAGSRLVRALFEGLSDDPLFQKPRSPDRVRCLLMPGVDAAAIPHADRIETVRGDLRNLDAVKVFCRDTEGATLFHCAGVVHPTLFVRDFFEVNVQGTRNLLQCAENAGIRRVVVLSSNSPFGVNPHRSHRFDETSPYNPYMGYGRSKMLMEKAVHEIQVRGRMETVILRPTWFYGPGQPARQTTFFHMIKNGKAPIVGDGENLRSMVYVDNLCQAILLCEHHPAANGQAYWVADPRPYSMNEIVDTVEKLMENEFGLTVAHKRLRLPSLASEIAWLCDATFQRLGFYVQKIHVLSEMNKTIACLVEKAQKELGYKPIVELEEGMRCSLAWCMEQGIPL